jgi:molybdate transport system substrate-binding protein
VATLDQAAQIGIVAPETTRGEWRNPLVIAGPRGASATDRTVAACDPSPASEIDGPRILERLGLRPARILGAVDTGEVAALVTSGTAQAGLLHMTDVRADPRLAVIHPVPEDIHAPIVYAAAVTRGARRPDPQVLVAFLATSGAMALLAESGLEVHA